MKKCKQIVGYNDEIIDLVFLPTPASTNGHPPLKQEANKIAMAANSDQLRIFDLTSFDCECHMATQISFWHVMLVRMDCG